MKSGRLRWRWKVRFGLRTMLLVTTVACLAVAWFSQPIVEHRLERKIIQRLADRGRLEVEYREPDALSRRFGSNFIPLEFRQRVTAIKALPPIRLIDIEGISRLRYLVFCDLSDQDLDDEQCELLTENSNIRILKLNGCPVTDASIDHLARIEKLAKLECVGTGISYAGLERLERSLPNAMNLTGARAQGELEAMRFAYDGRELIAHHLSHQAIQAIQYLGREPLAIKLRDNALHFEDANQLPNMFKPPITIRWRLSKTLEKHDAALIAKFGELEQLELRAPITDESLVELSKLRHIGFLSISPNTDSLDRDLLMRLMSVAGNGIELRRSSVSQSELANLPTTVQELHLRNLNYSTETFDVSIFRSLEVLTLKSANDGPVPPELVTALAKLPRLKELNLSGIISDETFDAMAQLPATIRVTHRRPPRR